MIFMAKLQIKNQLYGKVQNQSIKTSIKFNWRLDWVGVKYSCIICNIVAVLLHSNFLDSGFLNEIVPLFQIEMK